MRAFIAIPVPFPQADQLAALAAQVQAGRAVMAEDMHLTLAFLDDVDLPTLTALHDALDMIPMPPFDLCLAGLDILGGPDPRLVFIRAEGGTPLADLRARVQRAARAAGIDLPRDRFRPHVTLARFGRPLGPEAQARIGRFLSARADAALPPFRVTQFALYRSTLHPDGPVYDILDTYPPGLAAAPDWA